MLYGTGLRRGELIRLDVADWNREDGTLLIDGQKTGGERRVTPLIFSRNRRANCLSGPIRLRIARLYHSFQNRRAAPEYVYPSHEPKKAITSSLSKVHPPILEALRELSR